MRPLLPLWLVALGISAHALTLNELFESLKSSPAIIKDRLSVQESIKAADTVSGSLYPKVSAFASMEHYSDPTNLRPLLPTESAALIKNNEPLPFSQNLAKVGIKSSMPLYNGALYALIDELKMTHKSIESQKRLELLSKEAELVDDNGALSYFEALIDALEAQNSSIQKTKERIDAGVNNGRYAEAESLKLQNALSTLRIALEDAKAQHTRYTQQLRTLSTMEVDKSVPMRLKGSYDSTEEPLAITTLKRTLEAKTYAIKASEHSLFPIVTADATVFRGWGEAYNNHDDFHQDYGVIGVYATVPIVDVGAYRVIEKSRLAALQAQRAVEAKTIELEGQIKSLQSDEKSLKASLVSADERIASSERLVSIATLAVQNGRLSVEEYLRYEEALLEAKAAKASLEWKLWRAHSALAIIYGIDLADIME